MKVTGETFFKKGAEEVGYKVYLNSQTKGPLPDRALESFIPKAPKGQLLIFRKILIEPTKRIISKFISKNFSGKKTE